MNIQRYGFKPSAGGKFSKFQKWDEGDIVLYVDHLAALEAAVKEKDEKFHAYRKEYADVVDKRNEQIAALKRIRERGDNTFELLVAANEKIRYLQNDNTDRMTQIAALEEVHEDHHRLVRAMDAAINGEDGAAKQASLCDIVSQVVKIKADNSRQVEEIDRYRIKALDAEIKVCKAGEQIDTLKGEIDDLRSNRFEWIEKTKQQTEEIAALKGELSASVLREKLLDDKWRKENLDLAVMLNRRAGDNQRQAEEIKRYREAFRPETSRLNGEPGRKRNWWKLLSWFTEILLIAALVYVAFGIYQHHITVVEKEKDAVDQTTLYKEYPSYRVKSRP